MAVPLPEEGAGRSANTRALLLEIGPQIPKIAERHNVTIVAGPFVNREHTTVVITEAERSEDLDDFIVETRLNQWKSVRILPSLAMQAATGQIEEQAALF